MSPKEQRNAYIQYLLMKVEQADWHGVSDAANDLRELEARYTALRDEEINLNRS
jgi:hypothetical protein